MAPPQSPKTIYRHGRPAWGPLDLALERLRIHRLPYRWSDDDIKIWLAPCPACGSLGWDLRIRESFHGGPVSLMCGAGRCADADIRAALEREPVHPRIEAAEIREAEAWRFVDELRGAADRALQLVADLTKPKAAMA